jgi:DNA-binding response OmpR family regulator
MDGFDLAINLRNINPCIPIIFLTARNMVEDKIKGFQNGADDYLVKPFNIQELLMRIQAVIRRSTGIKNNGKEIIEIGGFTFNTLTRELSDNDQKISLSTKEAGILTLLLQNQNKLIPRKIILQEVWGDDNFFTSKSMDVYLTKLRKIFKKSRKFELINIHGTGYRFIVNG